MPYLFYIYIICLASHATETAFTKVTNNSLSTESKRHRFILFFVLKSLLITLLCGVMTWYTLLSSYPSRPLLCLLYQPCKYCVPEFCPKLSPIFIFLGECINSQGPSTHRSHPYLLLYKSKLPIGYLPLYVRLLQIILPKQKGKKSKFFPQCSLTQWCHRPN